MRGKRMYVYILASLSRTLYTGVTNSIERRMYEHRNKLTPGFATRYRVNRLVYFEVVYGPMNAIRREKQIKAWTRERRFALIESVNAGWLDLARDWFRETPSPSPISPQASGSGPSLRGSAATEESTWVGIGLRRRAPGHTK